MSKIGEFDINIIPNILMYFVPGYLAITVYCRITDTKFENAHKTWLSCVFSYLIILFVKLILPKDIEDNNVIVSLLSALLSSISALSLSYAIRKTSVKRFLSEKLNYSPTKDAIADAIHMDKTGSMMRVYLKGKSTYTEGVVSCFDSVDVSPWISLQYYTIYNIDDNSIVDSIGDSEKRFVFNVNDVEYIEVWPTVPADPNTKHI